MNTRFVFLAVTVLALSPVSAARALLLGPIGGSGLSGEYAAASDSPFSGTGFAYFYFEDFEDHLFNAPGVSASAGGVTSVFFGPSIHDAVDLDDGVLDGSSLRGDSFYWPGGAAGITFTFLAAVLGALPTHVGIVWTDGLGTTSFEAFDSSGRSLGSVGPVAIADGTAAGTTSEDRFFGVIDPGGVSAIRVSSTRGGIGGIEVDHLQYGLVPEPGLLLSLRAGLAWLLGYRSTQGYTRRPVAWARNVLFRLR